jgi:DNA polymerase-3 subunit delta'
MFLNIFKWQEDAWMRLKSQRGRLAHALLIYGQEGIGKGVLARQFAHSLLCQTPKPDGFACGTCKACHWLSQGAHPDFLLIQPESMSEEDGEDTEEGEGRKSKKKPSKHIRIEQIRDMQDTLSTGSHQAGLRVIIIEPADAMQAVTANALLKSLEEPPPGTLFLLISGEASRLLPTIRSRCQQVAVGPPDRSLALQWLREQGANDAEAMLAYAGGAPLKALALSEAGDVRREFARRLAEPGSDALALTDFCQTLDPPLVVAWIQQWAYDLISAATTGEVRYHGAQRDRLLAISAKLDIRKLHRFTRELTEARALSRHPLNARLFFEAIFLSYRTLGAAGNE